MDEIDNVMRAYLENNALTSLGDLVAKQQAEIERLKKDMCGRYKQQEYYERLISENESLEAEIERLKDENKAVGKICADRTVIMIQQGQRIKDLEEALYTIKRIENAESYPRRHESIIEQTDVLNKEK